MKAALRGHSDVLEILIGHGADVKAKNEVLYIVKVL